MRQTLRVRAERPCSFGISGEYKALWASGPRATCVVAYQRGADVVTVAARLRSNASDWEDTQLELPSGRWVNRLTGETVEGGRVPVAGLLARFPAALFLKADAAKTESEPHPAGEEAPGALPI